MTRIRVVERIDSTNAALLPDPSVSEGDWLVALSQDEGRGRQGRTWLAPEGNFAGSTVVGIRSSDPPASTLSLACGLALIEAVDAVAPGMPLQLKWPNDLLLGSGKLAGILLERTGDRVVCGFGVNLAAAPKIEGKATASLFPLATVTPTAFAPLLAASFDRLLTAWRSADPAAMATAWMARAHPLGTSLTVHDRSDQAVSGRFAGLQPDGALCLRLADGEEMIVTAGDVALA